MAQTSTQFPPSVNVGPTHLGPQLDMAELTRRHAQSVQGAMPGAMPPGSGRADADAAQLASSREPIPLRTASQEVVLFHRAHTHLKCRSAHPAVRLLAVVETMPPRQAGESPAALPVAWNGTRIIRDMQKKHDLDIFMQPVFQPVLVPRHQGALTPEQEQEKIEQRLTQHAERLQHNRQAFTANVQDCKEGAGAGAPAPEPAPEPEAAAAPPPVDMAGAVVDTPVGITSETRGQKMAVLSVVHDPNTVNNEPLVTIYGAFDTEDDARHYVDNTLSKHVIDQDLYVHPMYEWIYLDPKAMQDNHVPAKYRDSTLDAIMRRQRTHKHDIQQYMAKCQEDQVEPSIIDINLPPENERKLGDA